MLDARDLFLRKLADLESILLGPDQYDYLRAAAILRSFLLDSNRLIDSANQAYKLPIRYRARDVSRDLGLQLKIRDGVSILSVQDGLYPATAHNTHFVGDFTRDQFLNLFVGRVDGQNITVKDVILYAANKLGGVHFDERGSTKEMALRNSCNRFTLGNMTVHVRQIGGIARVVIEATRELRQRIESAHDSRRHH